MRKILISAVMGLALVLAGCGTFTEPSGIPVDTSLPAAAQEAQKAVNEANILLTASAKVVAQNRADGIYNDAQVADIKAQLVSLAKQVDEAQDLIRAGSFVSAESKAKLVNRLVIALHKKVSEEARK